MGMMKDMMYDIQEMFIDGYDAQGISQQLDLPYDQVIAVLEDFGVSVEDMNPYNTVNS